KLRDRPDRLEPSRATSGVWLGTAGQKRRNKRRGLLEQRPGNALCTSSEPCEVCPLEYRTICSRRFAAQQAFSNATFFGLDSADRGAIDATVPRSWSVGVGKLVPSPQIRIP